MSIRSLLSFVAIAVTVIPGTHAAGAPVANRAPLQANAFNALPLGSVMPKGWLLDQLRLQAKGLSGHLDEFWPDLGPQSAWLGGTGEGWERGPYYLDGLVPLAYLTREPALIAKVKKWMEWTLQNQRPDGGIGPVKNLDWWPNYVMLKALVQYQEASGDARVIPLMEKYFAYQLKHIDERPLKEWAIFRWHDEVLSVLWLYNRNGDRALLDLARKLHTQGHDWEAQFANFKTTERVPRGETNLSTHGVNNAMAMKAAAVWWLVTGDKGDRAGLYQMLDMLDRHHGQPNGIFSADEHYAGRDPSQGTELCAVVEAMFSLETDIAILGDAALGDRLEKIAYNALPATLSPDLWSHQYDQQANQVMCSISNRRWATNGPESNIFGLEPNFGCCTANMHQGWPKLAASLWMATPDDGLAAVIYGPSEVTTTLGGKTVTIDEVTDYPFRESVSLAVKLQGAARFPLMLRIPVWAGVARVTVNGQAVAGVKAGEFLRIEREWKSGDKVELRFPMAVRTSTWFNNSLAVERGPLVYSLKIGESWNKIKQIGPAADWEVYPTSPWNYALLKDTFNVTEKPMQQQPYTATAAPVEITAKARRLPQWTLVDDSPGAIPVSPVTTKRPEEIVTLVPYGAARLRITAFPWMQ
ncbi:MAG: beta-L-arabinofuranosidase domain-containing protein [Candidatus Solibacter sp.]